MSMFLKLMYILFQSFHRSKIHLHQFAQAVIIHINFFYRARTVVGKVEKRGEMVYWGMGL